MDIRTKLALILVFVSLISMTLLGAFAYLTSSELLREISIRQLDALAESKSQDLSKVYQSWQDQARLIRGAIELESLFTDDSAGDIKVGARLEHLVGHAMDAVKSVQYIKIVLDDGEILSWGEKADHSEVLPPEDQEEVRFGGVFLGDDGRPRVVFTTLLTVDRHLEPARSPSIIGDTRNIRRLGFLEFVFDASELETVTSNYTGLGETGEALLVTSKDGEGIMVLNELRHQTTMPVLESLSKSRVIQQVLEGESGIIVEDVDYRGENVLAAIRYLDDFEWGLVVKVDATEESYRADTLLDAMFDIGLALSAFAIIGGTLLGFYLAKPIHELAVLVGRVRHGEMTLRAKFDGDDEIAYLAESLNELLDHLPPTAVEDKKQDV
ncbi:MAG: HAMP domain-containing protein [Pseudomonadales bacterium]|nr:HAMP domain-containing protein [Pseudomonadales bacterium]